MTFPVVVELDVNGTWVDVSKRVRRMSPPSIRRGRPDEASQSVPMTTSVVFDNTDGYLSPRNPNSPWYPYVKRGMGCRVSVDAGPRYLNLTGNTGGRATTPDNAALDIVGDIFLAVEIEAPVALPPLGTRYQILAKYNVATSNQSYYLALTAAGKVVLFWTTGGTDATIASATSTLALPQWTSGAVAFSVWLDVNFLGVAYLVSFHVVHGSIADLLAAMTVDETLVRLGDVIVGGATTSIFSGTAALEIGDITGTGDNPYPGRIRRAQVRSGTFAGTIAANPDFTTQTVGGTTFTDSATRVWTVEGDARISNRQTRFVGFVDAIGLNWPKATKRDISDPGVATATFGCSGLLRSMQQGAKPFNSTLHRLISSPSVSNLVHAYWPLEDGRDADLNASPMPNVRPGSILGATLANDDTLDASEPLPTVDGNILFRWRFDVPPTIPLNTNFQSTMFIKIPAAPVSADELQFMVVDTSSIQVRTWALQINDTIVRLRGIDHTGTEVINDTLAADARMFGMWMLVDLKITQNGGNIDWAYTMILIPGGFGFGKNGSIAGSCGRPTRLRAGSTSPDTPSGGSGFSFGHFIVTTNAATGWLAGADTAWVNETAAHRAHRLCTEEQIPVVIVGDNTIADFFRGNTQLSQLMGPQRPATFLELLQECANADEGILYEQRNQTGLAFRTHKSLQNQAVALTFADPAAGLVEPFEPTLDDQRIRNDVTVTRPQGSSARVVDIVSTASEGVYDEDVTVNVSTDLQLPDQAGWRLHLGTWPELRFPAISTSMLAASDMILVDWIDVDLGDRIVATNLMRQFDATTEQLLEGYDETLSLFNWEVGFNGSPALPWEVGVRNDAGRGKRGTAGSQLASGITTTATSLSVATTLGPLWSDVDADDGFDINIGGERMTVTDISGTTSPQTFTVVRSINGVVKAHSTAAAVSLWRATVRAL